MAESNKTQATTEASPDRRHRTPSIKSPTPEVFPTFEGMSGSPELEGGYPESAQGIPASETTLGNVPAPRSSNGGPRRKGRGVPDHPQEDPVMEPQRSLGRDFSQSTFERHAALLGDRRLSHPANARKRIQIARQLQRDYGNQYVQRLVRHVSRQRDTEANVSFADSPLVQKAKEEDRSGHTYPVSPEIASRIDNQRLSGRPLDLQTRREMESFLGRNLGDVRVHTGPEAHELNREVEAEAFTAGEDIFFRNGNYAPRSAGGKELLAHELTHVVGQRTQNNDRGSLQATEGSEDHHNLGEEVGRQEDGELEPSANGGSEQATGMALHRCGAMPCDCFSKERRTGETAGLTEGEVQQITEGEEDSKPGVQPIAISRAATLTKRSNTDQEASTNEVSDSATERIAETAPETSSAAGTVAGPYAGTSSQATAEATGKNEDPALQEGPPGGEGLDSAAAGPPEDGAAEGASEGTRGDGSAAAADTGAPSAVPERKTEVDSSSAEDVAPAEANPTVEAMEGAVPKGEMQALEQEADAQKQAEDEQVEEKAEGAASPDGASEAQTLQEAVAGDEAGAQQETAAIEAGAAEAAAGRDQAAAAVQAATAQLQAANAGVAQLASARVDFTPINLDELAGNGQGQAIARQAAAPPADLSAAVEEQRIQANTLAQGFISDAANRVQAIVAVGDQIPGRIQAASDAARAMVDAASQQQSAAVSAHIAQVRAQAEGTAQAAQSQIEAEHQASIAEITQTTDGARSQIEAEYNAALQLLEEREAAQLQAIDQIYTDGDAAYRQVGQKVGQEAIREGEERAQDYLKGKIDRMDSLTDGYLTDRRCEARAKAAREVAKAYSEGLIEEANKQADEAQKGKTKDYESVGTTVARTRETLESQHNAILENLSARQDQSVATANESKTKLMQSVQQVLTSALQNLDQQETFELQAIESAGQQQTASIEQASQAAAAALLQNVAQAAAALQSQILTIQGSLSAVQVPDIASLEASLGNALAQIDTGVADLQAQVEEALAQGEQNLASSGQEVVGALAEIGQRAIEGATTTGDGLNTTMSDLMSGASDTSAQLRNAHADTVSGLQQSATQSFQQQMSGIDTTFQKENANLEASFARAPDQLETGLKDQAFPKMRGDIETKAEEAAAAEQPAWKSIVKWVLIIAVVIVIAVVAGPLVIGAVGGLAASLGASTAAASAIGMIVGGAIVGAAASGTIQIINNWAAAGQPLKGSAWPWPPALSAERWAALLPSPCRG